MSGPIIRKYGFPNHDQIFGKRDLEHGTDAPAKPAEASKEEKPKASEETKPADKKA